MPFLLGLLHAAIYFLAFEPLNWWPLAMVAAVPTAFAASRVPATWKTAALFGLGTAPFYAIHHWFIGNITNAGMPPLVLYMALWPAVTVWLLARVMRRWPRLPIAIAAPTVWVGVEMFRGELFMGGYSWYTVGLPMINAPAGGLAPLVGIYGVGFHVVLIGSLIFAIVRRGVSDRRRHLSAAALILAVIAIFAVSRAPLSPASSERPVRVALVQTDVPQSNKLRWSPEKAVADFQRLLELHAAAASAKPDFIVWPETMKPSPALTDAQIADFRRLLAKYPKLVGYIENSIAYGEFAREQIARGRVPTLVGQETVLDLDFREKDGRWTDAYSARYNSAYLVAADGSVADKRYDKLQPTPFGENIPWISVWPWLKNKMLDFAAGGMRVDLSAGTERTVFDIPAATPIRVVTPICFESTDTDLCRSLAYEHGEKRADLLVCMTNDGWFGDDDWGRRHHLQMARWRCLELGVPMARAANTGMSAFIDARGRLLTAEAGSRGAIEALAAHRDGVVVGTLRTSTAPTLYGRIGNVVGWVTVLSTALLALSTFFRPASRSSHERTPPSPPVSPAPPASSKEHA